MCAQIRKDHLDTRVSRQGRGGWPGNCWESFILLDFICTSVQCRGGSSSVGSKPDLTAKSPGEIFQNRVLGFRMSGNLCVLSCLPPKTSHMILRCILLWRIPGLEDCHVFERTVLLTVI